MSGDFIEAFVSDRSTPTSLDGLIARMERGEFDLIAVGRALIADPDWAVKVRASDTAALKGFSTAMLGEFV